MVLEMSKSRDVERARHHRLSLPKKLKRVNVKVGFGIGDVEVTGLDAARTLFEGNYENEKPLRFQLLQDEGRIVAGDWSSVNWIPYFWLFLGDCHIKLNKRIPLRIAIDGRLGDTDLNLSELKLQDLRVRNLLGDLGVRFPKVGAISGLIVYTLGDITLSVPRELGALIRLGSAVMGKCRMDEELFERRGSQYISKGFEKTKNRLDLEIDFHLGDLRITST